MEEKRSSVRIEKPLMVKYLPQGSDKENWRVAFIKNISETGLLFDTNSQFQSGDSILLMIKIPLKPDDWIDTKGSVIESFPFVGRSFLTRLKFTGMNHEQRALIKDYVSWFLNTQTGGKSPGSDNDKRKAVRIYKNITVRYGVQNHLGVVEKWDITTVINLSKTGLVFTSGFACSETIDFMIKLPSHPYEPFHIRGRVIESSQFKLADSTVLKDTFLTRVEFIYPKEEYKKLLFDYVDWLIKNDQGKPKKEGE